MDIRNYEAWRIGIDEDMRPDLIYRLGWASTIEELHERYGEDIEVWSNLDHDWIDES